MEITHNHNAKSQLAKLLATENITVEHRSDTKTAYFDVKNRVLVLPIWRDISNDLYDLLVVHEVGHALDTPPDGWVDEITKIAGRVHGKKDMKAESAVRGFLNVLEDARIDKRQKRRFPGSRRNYVAGYQELIERDFFGTQNKNVNDMLFIDRLNIYFKGGALMGIRFSDEEKKFIKKIASAETFEEIVELTEETYKFCQTELKRHMKKKKGSNALDGFSGQMTDEEKSISMPQFDDEDEDDGMTFPPPASDEIPEDDEPEDNDDEDEDDEKEESFGGNPYARDNGKPDSDEAVEDDDEDLIPQSETEEAWQKKQAGLILDSNIDYVYVSIPRPTDYKKMVDDYKTVLADWKADMSKQLHYTYRSPEWIDTIRKDFMSFKASENATISYMVKEFEMRKSADEYARTSISKTGMIDTNKLHSYKFNDDIFRRITTVATGKNHGFVMFVDWSQSMTEGLKKTIKQLLSLVMFCKRVQIPFEVYLFKNTGNSSSWNIKQNSMILGNLKLRNILSSRMSIAELNEAMFRFYMCAWDRPATDGMGGTPLNETIAVADLVVNQFKARNKVQVVNTIFLTDGESNGFGGFSSIAYTGKRRKFILQDEVTKKSYEFGGTFGSVGTPSNYGYGITKMLLQVLRGRIDGNLIGFFIARSGFSRIHSTFAEGTSYADTMKNQSSWKTEGFFTTDKAGYDEYYLIKPSTFDLAEEKELQIDPGKMKKGQITNAFKKFSENKRTSRVLLNRFIKKIAS